MHFSLDQLENVSFQGMIIDFGDNYPTDFIMETNAGEVTYNCDSSIFEMEDSFSNITFIRIKPVTMKKAGRLRVFSIMLQESFVYADSDRILTSVPKITIDLEAAYVAYGFRIRFRNVAPEEFHVVTYYEGTVVTEYTITNSGIEFITYDRLELFDQMVVTFPK